MVKIKREVNNNVNNSSFIPLKYFYFSTLSLSKMLYLSHPDMSLKIPLLQILGYCVHNYAHVQLFPHPHYCATGDIPSVASVTQNCIPACFILGVKQQTDLTAYQEPYFHL